MQKHEMVDVRLETAAYLVASESAEFVLPLVYLAFLLIASHSVNAKFMVGIGVSGFGEARPDIQSSARSIGLATLGDMVASFFTYLITHKLDVNIIGEFLKEMDTYWAQTAVTQCWILFTICSITYVHCMEDETFQFAWLDGHEGQML